MRRASFLAVVTLLAVVPLWGCGNDTELKVLQSKIEGLEKENGTLKGQLHELEASLEKLRLERDQYRTAAEAAVVAVKPVPCVQPAKAVKSTRKKTRQRL